MTQHQVGTTAAFESKSSDPRLRCVFEDDGQTGYLYALDHTDGEAQPIKDAVALYKVSAANDLTIFIEFRWSADGRRCAVYLNQVFEGFVDFDRHMVCAKSNFPAVSLWTRQGRSAWTDALAEALNP